MSSATPSLTDRWSKIPGISVASEPTSVEATGMIIRDECERLELTLPTPQSNRLSKVTLQKAVQDLSTILVRPIHPNVDFKYGLTVALDNRDGRFQRSSRCLHRRHEPIEQHLGHFECEHGAIALWGAGV